MLTIDWMDRMVVIVDGMDGDGQVRQLFVHTSVSDWRMD